MSIETLVAALEKHRFTVSKFATSAEAVKYLADNIKGETVGFGGSVTLRDMGLYEELAKANTAVWHWKNPDDRYRYPEFTVYLTSVNAIAETGEMVNIDGSGNRIGASLFGPKRIYFIIGRNKITPDLASAIERARNIASPPNAKRLKHNTPCVQTGTCHDCNSPERLCNALCIYMRPMVTTEHTEVVLVDEDLGF